MANLVRWSDPFAELSTLHNRLDDIFNSFFSSGQPLLGQTMPALDVYSEGDKQLVAEVHAPGFDSEDIEVNINNGVLEIRGQKGDRQEEGKQSDRNYMVRESHASFYRSIVLPKQAQDEGVKASFENGVLKVTVPFKELPAPKKIAIENTVKSKSKS